MISGQCPGKLNPGQRTQLPKNKHCRNETPTIGQKNIKPSLQRALYQDQQEPFAVPERNQLAAARGFSAAQNAGAHNQQRAQHNQAAVFRK
jgi:hypothetical protein